MELPDIKSSLATARDAHSKSVGNASRWIKGVLVIGGAMAAGIAQFWTWPSTGPEPAQVIGIFASFLVGLGGFYVVVTEQDAAVALRAGEQAIEAAEAAEAQAQSFGVFFSAFDRLSATYRLCLTMRGAIEQTRIGVAGGINDQLKALFDRVSRELSIAVGFAHADRWTIGIYRAKLTGEAGRAVLKCIAQTRALPCELNEARSWPEGIGIAGIAYSNGREVVIPDLRAEGMQAVFGPKGQARAYDADRYVSMVAVPILIAGRDKPWGVVSATSDKTGHFSAEGLPGFKTDEPIRALAAFVALAVAIHDTASTARPSSLPVAGSPSPSPPPDSRRQWSVRSGSNRP